jgi:hypothetical protein
MAVRARLEVEVHGHDEVHLRSSLLHLDPCVHPALIGALADHLGYEVRPLRKAVEDPADVDPRYPWLRTLIRRARDLWSKWGDLLVEEIRKLLRRGDLVPMTRKNEAIINELLREHEVGFLIEFSGYAAPQDQTHVDSLVGKGLVSEDYAETALVPISYRKGRGLEALAAHEVPDDQSPPLEEVVREALEVLVTPKDEAAIAYARRRAATYMRRPVVGRTTEAERILTEAERWAIAETVARAVERRTSADKLAQELRAAVQYTSLTNDMDRVARTELHAAHAHGAYETLKTMAKNTGEDDPYVYKLVRPGACVECRRIWGPPEQPIVYRLSYIEQREAAGGNFRLPAKSWGPVVGPVHPNCTEGALLLYREEIFDAQRAALADLDATFGRT